MHESVHDHQRHYRPATETQAGGCREDNRSAADRAIPHDHSLCGTYKFDGTTIEHNIEISMNEVWSGTKQVRSVKRDGDRLIYSTPPFPFHTDGKMSVNTLVWEKVK
jgi:hypothetical protein